MESSPVSAAVQAYLKKKAALEATPVERPSCLKCHKPQITCYCASVKAFESDPQIVILMHPQEEKHPVGTGRMTHQCLSNSSLIVDSSFENNDRVQRLLNDETLFPMIMYPGKQSTNLTLLSNDEREALAPPLRRPIIFVIDGTWHHARKMLYLSPTLQMLPKISFTPPRLSGFLVRKQPHEQCFSTIEAVHETLRLLGHAHDSLLEVFNEMVRKQLSFRGTQLSRHRGSYLARKARRQKWKEEKLRLAASP